MTRSSTSFYSLLLAACLALSGCGAQEELEDAAESLPDDVDLNVKVCGDQTLDDLIHGDTISDACRDKVEGLLPKPQTSFESRLVLLGEESEAGGGRTLYVMGADADGKALFTDVPTDIEVSVRGDGEARVLAEGELSIELPEAGELLSLGLVNDYSASMRNDDLRVVSEIETDLFTYLPAIYEAEVTQFSTMVDTVLPFTADKSALLSSVAVDESYERASTALYDGMGVGLASLAKRTRPLRVLIVSTDGAENASTMVTEPALVSSIDEHEVIVIMLGALFADVDTMKRLAGDRGIYVYARAYSRLKSAVEGLIDSLTHVAAIHLPDAGDKDEVTIKINGQTLTVAPAK